MEDLYRKNAAVVVCNRKGKVLICQRVADIPHNWQFPQGGIEDGETPLEAAYRELSEETGLTKVDLIAQYPQGIKYRFTDDIIEKFRKMGRLNIGQEHFWTLFLNLGSDDDINFKTHPEEIEFKAYRWVDLEEAVESVVPFKKESYQKMAAYFKPFIEQIKKAKTN